MENPSNFSICGGIKTNIGFAYGYEEDAKYTVVHTETTDDFSKVCLKCTIGDAHFVQTLVVYNDYVEVSVEGSGEVRLLFPVFDTDGKNKSKVTVADNSVSVSYFGCKCIYTSKIGTIQDLESTYANRNGHYKAYALGAVNKVQLKIAMQEEE